MSLKIILPPFLQSGQEDRTLVVRHPPAYKGLIPQNCEWTEFVDEKTGEWLYLDEYGQRVEKGK